MHTQSVKRYAASPWEKQTSNKPVKISWRKTSPTPFPQALYNFHSLGDHLTFFFSICYIFPLCLFFPLFISTHCLFSLDWSGRKNIWASLVGGPPGMYYIVRDITKTQTLQLIPRTDCWHWCLADKWWNFQNIFLLKMLTTCQAECSPAYMWHWGNTDFASPECRSEKVKKGLSVLPFLRLIFVFIGKLNKTTIN